MKVAPALVALLALLIAGPVRAGEGFSLLYQGDSWVVFRFEAKEPGDPPSYCSARSMGDDETSFFELIGTAEFSCLSAEASDWRFRKQEALGGFFVGETGYFWDPTRYFSNGLQYCMENQLADMFIASLAQAGGPDISVYDYRKQPIGSFPAAGMDRAVDRWSTCRNGL